MNNSTLNSTANVKRLTKNGTKKKKKNEEEENKPERNFIAHTLSDVKTAEKYEIGLSNKNGLQRSEHLSMLSIVHILTQRKHAHSMRQQQ